MNAAAPRLAPAMTLRTRAGMIRMGTILWMTILVPFVASAGAADALDLDELRARVDRLGQRVAQVAGTDDLVDTLHFRWFDRPYARATLAVVVKVAAALGREVRLRDLGNGAIPDATVHRMLLWADGALERVMTVQRDARFRPHRLRVTGSNLRESATVAPLFAFVDRSTATRYHDRFGDLDILAALGMRVYARPGGAVVGANASGLLRKRTRALGMATVFVETPPVVLTKMDALRGDESIVEPVTLGMLLASDETLMVVGNRLPALSDPTYGESWPASLARRALARGASRRSRFPMVNWVAPSPRSAPAHRAAGVSAAMWVHALEGQSLGLLRGWRDLRDGSASPYASVILDPAQLEAIAHTALDLIRHADSIARFDAMPSLAIALDSDAVDVRDDNAWAKWTLPIWAALANRQIRFDVVRTADRIHDERRSQRYRVVFPLRREQAGDANAIALRIERTMSVQGGYVSGITARGSDGKPARDVYVRSVRATSRPPHIALVNLSDRPRRLKLHGGSNLGVMRDLLTGEPVEKPDELIRLAPWQVRLLGPGSPSKK